MEDQEKMENVLEIGLTETDFFFCIFPVTEKGFPSFLKTRGNPEFSSSISFPFFPRYCCSKYLLCHKRKLLLFLLSTFIRPTKRPNLAGSSAAGTDGFCVNTNHYSCDAAPPQSNLCACLCV